MVANIRCDNCGLLFAIPGGAQAPWVACPRCGENNFNPDVIRRGGDTGVNWTGFLGTMLMLGAIFGWCSRSVAIGLEH